MANERAAIATILYLINMRYIRYFHDSVASKKRPAVNVVVLNVVNFNDAFQRFFVELIQWKIDKIDIVANSVISLANAN